MNDEPAFPVDGTDFEKLNNEDVKNLGYEVFVDDQTGKKMVRRLKLSAPWVKQVGNKGVSGYYNWKRVNLHVAAQVRSILAYLKRKM